MNTSTLLILIAAAAAYFWPTLKQLFEKKEVQATEKDKDVDVKVSPMPDNNPLIDEGLKAFPVESRNRVGFLLYLRDSCYTEDEVAVSYLNYLIRCETDTTDIDWPEEEVENEKE